MAATTVVVNAQLQEDTSSPSPFIVPPELLELSALASSSASPSATLSSSSSSAPSTSVQVFVGQWDQEGVYVYQAFNDAIADYAVANQTFAGCPEFNPHRMTWVKPSFGWVLYRSGYGTKHNQNRVLKVKLSHQTIADILSRCTCVDTNKATKASSKASRTSGGCDDGDDGGNSNGRVQWDPERDVMEPSPDGKKEPRAMLRQRAIQIGLAGSLSEFYVANTMHIEDVTPLAQQVGAGHGAVKLPPTVAKSAGSSKKKLAAAQAEYMKNVVAPQLPVERPYMPALCSRKTLVALALLPGETADAMARLGRGKAL